MKLRNSPNSYKTHAIVARYDTAAVGRVLAAVLSWLPLRRRSSVWADLLKNRSVIMNSVDSIRKTGREAGFTATSVLNESSATECRADRPGSVAPLPEGVTVDRRRPGRRADISPHLLPLLRGAATVGVPPQPLFEDADEHCATPLVGIVSGVLLSSILWCLVGAAGWIFLH